MLSCSQVPRGQGEMKAGALWHRSGIAAPHLSTSACCRQDEGFQHARYAEPLVSTQRPPAAIWLWVPVAQPQPACQGLPHAGSMASALAGMSQQTPTQTHTRWGRHMGRGITPGSGAPLRRGHLSRRTGKPFPNPSLCCPYSWEHPPSEDRDKVLLFPPSSSKQIGSAKPGHFLRQFGKWFPALVAPPAAGIVILESQDKHL